MLIEFSDRLVNFNFISCIRVHGENMLRNHYFVCVNIDDTKGTLREEFDTEQQAKARFEEIKKKLKDNNMLI